MLLIFAGEDTAAARKAFIENSTLYTEKGYSSEDISSKDIAGLSSQMLKSAQLFAQHRMYTVEGIPADKKGKDVLKSVQHDADTLVLLLDETHYEADLKRMFPKARVLFFKLPTSIFQLLDGLYPGNAKGTLKLIRELMADEQDFGLFFMLRKRLRELLLVKHNESPKGIAPWQVQKLQSQANRWEQAKLEKLYDSCYEIEKNIKTGENTYTLKKSLELLFGFSL